MIAELGHFALITGFTRRLAQGGLPLFGAARGNSATMLIAPAAAISVALAVAFSFGALVWGFITSDFSLALVANHYGAYTGRTASAILVSTVFASTTVPVFLYWLFYGQG